MKKLINLLSLNLLVLMLGASCNSTGMNRLGFADGDDDDILLAESVEKNNVVTPQDRYVELLEKSGYRSSVESFLRKSLQSRLFWATERALPKIVELLLQDGADPNSKPSGYRKPILILAVSPSVRAKIRFLRESRYKVTKLLLEHGADPHAYIRDMGVKFTAYYFARQHGNSKAAKLIKEYQKK